MVQGTPTWSKDSSRRPSMEDDLLPRLRFHLTFSLRTLSGTPVPLGLDNLNFFHSPSNFPSLVGFCHFKHLNTVQG